MISNIFVRLTLFSRFIFKKLVCNVSWLNLIKYKSYD